MDPHFQGFARLLWIRLRAEMMLGSKRTLAEQGAAMERIIAKAGDILAYHVLLEADLDADYYERFGYDTHAVVNSIPDFDAWPEET